jgi:hypothetical protein
MDKAVHLGATGRTALVSVYYVHECDDNGAGESWMDVIDDARVFLVSARLRFSLGGKMTTDTDSRLR